MLSGENLEGNLISMCDLYVLANQPLKATLLYFWKPVQNKAEIYKVIRRDKVKLSESIKIMLYV